MIKEDLHILVPTLTCHSPLDLVFNEICRLNVNGFALRGGLYTLKQIALRIFSRPVIADIFEFWQLSPFWHA